MITFKYLGKTYQVFSDLDKKLKRMGITENDIEIISDKIVEYEDNKDLHEYKNMYNNHTITSIYPTIDELEKHLNSHAQMFNRKEWVQVK